MDLSQHVRAIISFVEAADSQSFAAASRKLKITSAAVSKNIASLEKVLGVRLMNRTTRTLSLTKEGELFLAHVRIALGALENAVDMVMTEKNENRGHVRISTSAAFGSDFIVPELVGLIKEFTNLTVEVDFDDNIIDLVDNGYDIVIRGGKITDSAFISRSICKMPTVLVASPEYLSRHGIPDSAAELSNHTLIPRKFIDGRISPWGFKGSDGTLSFITPKNAKITLTNPKSLTDVAVLGLGIAQVGVHNCLKEIENGALKVLLFDEHDPGDFEMVIQYPHRALIAQRVQTTVQYLLDKLRLKKELSTPLKELRQYSV